MILAHWTYTRDEWKAFIRWTKRKRSFVHYLLHLFFHSIGKHPPEVKITPGKVWMGEDYPHFSSDEHRLKRIDIREEGSINIMEITFEHNGGGKKQGLNEILFPVPKGKLREAIAIQETMGNQASPA